jgi:hypothetical protein
MHAQLMYARLVNITLQMLNTSITQQLLGSSCMAVHTTQQSPCKHFLLRCAAAALLLLLLLLLLAGCIFPGLSQRDKLLL